MKYWPSAGECAPLIGSAAAAMLIPIAPPICSAAMIGAPNESCRTKPSVSPTSTSPAIASIPSSENSAGGTVTGTHAQTSTAIAAVIATRSCTGTAAAPKNGAASKAAPMRVITNSSFHNSASTAPKPKASWITGPSPRSAGRSRS